MSFLWLGNDGVKVGLLVRPSGWVPFESELHWFGPTPREGSSSPGARRFVDYVGNVTVSPIRGCESWTLCRGVMARGEGGRLYGDRTGHQDTGVSLGLFIGSSNGDRPYGGRVGSSVLGTGHGLFVGIPGGYHLCGGCPTGS